MILFTNHYENQTRVFSRLFLTYVEVSKRYHNHIKRYSVNKIFRYIYIKLESKCLGKVEVVQR